MTEIRLASDQMRELKLCILATGFIESEDCDGDFNINWERAKQMLKAEPPKMGTTCSNAEEFLQLLKDAEQHSREHPLRLDEDIPTPIVSDDTLLKQQSETIARLEGTIDQLKADNSNLQRQIEELKTELSKCAFHGAFEEYEDDNAALRLEIEELKKQIPKKRLNVAICCKFPHYYFVSPVGVELSNRISPYFSESSDATQYALDHGFEVVV